MEKEIVCWLFSSLLITGVFGQSDDGTHKNQGESYAVSAGIDIPVGEFPRSHSFGAGTDLSWSNHRFGLMVEKPLKAVGFIANGGIDYYFGRDRTISMYQFKYGSFVYIHTYAGIIYNPCKKGNINLTAGPALGMEDRVAEFWWGVNLSGSYYLDEKIAITPAIILMKQSIADPLVAVTLRATRTF